jgi:hypothetical protein
MKAIYMLFITAGLLLGCTKAPEPVPKFKPLISTTMLPMSGRGEYSGQIIIWKAYTRAFAEFSELHLQAEIALYNKVEVSSIKRRIISTYDKAYAALYTIDSQFSGGIYNMTNGNDPGVIMVPIQEIDFSGQGKLRINELYPNVVQQLKTQLNNIIINNANNQSPEYGFIKKAAGELIRMLDDCSVLMRYYYGK